MPRKAYIADLKRLSTDPASAIDGISDVRSGDDDGEFRFKVTSSGASQPYDISALIPGMCSHFPVSVNLAQMSMNQSLYLPTAAASISEYFFLKQSSTRDRFLGGPHT